MKSARLALAAIALAALTGCSVTNPIQTQVVYSASDGARIVVGESHRFVGEDLVRFDAVDARPGQTLPITVSSGTEGAVSATVPVLDGTLPEYAEVLESL
jgi:hypothetical protein